ncbi:MAG: pirin family protein [Acidobacteria bacterium]|nr:pirin family protein [Acidobacteriota bacterium]
MSELERACQASASSDCPRRPGRPVLVRIEARTAEIGEGFTIRRAVPNRQRRMVGAWCFLDHAGPVDYGPGKGLRVGPHPHIGLQTFTWMIEGEVMHRDSLAFEQVIRPGQVNLMTAGGGIVHAEDSVTDEAGRLHAAQLWIALPDAERHRAPSFHHYPELPIIESGGFLVTVLAGTAFSRTAPTQVFSPLVGMDFAASAAAHTAVPLHPAFEHAALTLSGEVEVEGERLAPGTLLYLGSARDQLGLRCDAAARLLLIGGEPFTEEILLWWNFVARTPQEMLKATEDWNARRYFGDVEGSPSPRLIAPDLAGLNLNRARR